MKIYADNLSADDIYDSLPSGVRLDLEPIPRPRVRRYGWTVRLEKPGSNAGAIRASGALRALKRRRGTIMAYGSLSYFAVTLTLELVSTMGQ